MRQRVQGAPRYAEVRGFCMSSFLLLLPFAMGCACNIY
jgi:hypothetical protein